uniref:Uncharacterized protein n=1 Tax=Vombatus ursinus TaxID=29139 RepID=A0A4X2MDM8_VOMUR
MSQFFAAGSDSESKSSLSREELALKADNYGKQPLLLRKAKEASKWVVISAKDKRFEDERRKPRKSMT